MKKNSEKGVTTVRLTDLAEALLLSELAAQQKSNPEITKTDVLNECVMEHVKRQSPERALQAMIAVASQNPAWQEAIDMISSSSDNPNKKVEELTKMVVLAVAGQHKGQATQPQTEVPAPPPSVPSSSKKKPVHK